MGKMMRNHRWRAVLSSVAVCLSLFASTAFAGNYFASDEGGAAKPPDAIDDITLNTEGVTIPDQQGDTPLTPDGNMNLIDNILQNGGYYVSEEKKVEDKQFITVQSKNGNYFYLVIDRSGDTENVYFLNLVDEADLLALLEETDPPVPICICTDKCAVGTIRTDCEVCRSTMSACAGKEVIVTPPPDNPAEEPETVNAGVILVALLLLSGSGALYWFKFRNKSEAKPENPLDEYEDEDEYEYETEENEDE